MPLFSVIVPIYNVEKYLEKCLNSIKMQTYDDFEIILVDDGSTDKSSEICDEYIKKDSRFYVIHKRNEGLVEARKSGIRIAKGEYAVFIDGDDWIEPNMLEEYYKLLCNKKIDILALGFAKNYSNHQNIFYNRISPGYYTRSKMVDEVFPHMLCMDKYFEFGIYPSIWSKVIRTELIKKVIWEISGNITMGEDAALVYPCILYSNNILICNQWFYHYRNLDSSMSQKCDEKYFEKVDNLLKRFVKIPEINNDRQFLLYKLFLLQIGVEQFLLQGKNFQKSLEKIKHVCECGTYKEALKKISLEEIGTEENALISALKNKKYNDIAVLYFFKRMKKRLYFIIHKIMVKILRKRG